MSPDWVAFEASIAEAVCSSPPALGIARLVEGVQTLTECDAAVLYMLHLEKAHFVPVVGDSTSIQGAPTALDVDVSDHNLHSSFADHAIRKACVISRSLSNSLGDVVQLAVPVKRDASCLGLLLLQRQSGRHFSQQEQTMAMIATDTIVPLVEKQSSFQLLKAVQEPINFHQSLNDYLEQLLLLISDASGMPMIAIREFHAESQSLRCIASFGLGVEKSDLDLEPLENYGPFKQAMDSRKPLPFPDAKAVEASMGSLLDRGGLADVRSFVVAPILVGDSNFGTLSFAASTRYNYSPLEITGFETIANVIGTSITNYRNSQKVSQLYQIGGEVAIGLTALEVAQAARHEARSVIDSINVELASLRLLTNKPKENLAKIQDTLERVFDNAQDIRHALDKIQNVSKPPKRELAINSLREVIREAAALVSGRIDKERVKVRLPIKDIEIDLYSERLRHAFLNLFLNSLDAFTNKKKQSDREVVVTIDPGSLSTDEVRVRFTDNATGIDPAKLRLPSRLETQPTVNELIFSPGVTSKNEGSGHGLFLVRRIIDEHKGSIDLLDYRGGVVFEIRIPKNLANRLSKRSE